MSLMEPLANRLSGQTALHGHSAKSQKVGDISRCSTPAKSLVMPCYPEYKDSRVAWLGEVPAHWDVKPVKAVASCNDEVLEESTLADYEIEYVEISGVDAGRGITSTEIIPFGNAPSRARRCLKDGDVLVSTVRTYLRAIALVITPPENMIASTGFAVIRPRSVTPHFLGYLFQSEFLIAEVIARSVGVSYPAINASDLMRLHVPIPMREEQSAIAAFLDRETGKIDALVAEQEKLIRLLREKRQAVISHAVTKGLPSTGSGQAAARMKDSGIEWLGEVPAHWEIKRLGMLSSQIQTGPFGSQLHAEDYVENETPVINPSNINDGKFYPDWSCTVGEEIVERLSQHKLIVGDIVFARRGEMGRCALVSENEAGWLCGTGSLNVRLNTHVSAEFVDIYLRTPYVRELLKLESVGSTMDNLNTEILSKVPVPVPPILEQTAIAAFLDRQTTKLDALTAEAQRGIELLKERRSALISAAVTGKIDVRGAS